MLIPSLLIAGALAACNNDTAMVRDRTTGPYTGVNNSGTTGYYNHVGTDNAGRNNRYVNYGDTNNSVKNNRYSRVAYDTNATDRINHAVRNVRGVDKARTVIYGDNVLVAVTTDAGSHRAIEKSIKKIVAKYSTGKDVAVIFGEDNYRKLTDISNDVYDGKNIDIDNRIRDSFRDVRNNVRRGVNDLDLVPNNR